MRYSMPNARIMIHQPQSGCGVRIKLSKFVTKDALEILEDQVIKQKKLSHKLYHKRSN